MALPVDEDVARSRYDEKEDDQVRDVERIEPRANSGVGNTPHPLRIFSGVHRLFILYAAKKKS